MNKLQAYLVRAGNELGIQVIAPFELKLESGARLCAEALLPQLGAPKGTVVIQSYDEIRHIADELKKLGYTFSSFGEPLPNEDYDVEGYMEMFRDWGWASDEERKPDWME